MPAQYPQWMMHARTPLGRAYFNPIWQAIDTRLLALEALRASWEQALADLLNHGLERLDAALLPNYQQLDNMLSEAAALLDGLRGLGWYLPADTAAYAYDGEGRVQTLTETLGGAERVSAYSYDGAGRVQQIQTTYQGRIRTATYGYDGSGRLIAFAATEEAVP